MRAVLFDLDGTLADTRALYAAAYHQAFVDVLGEAPSWEAMLAQGPTSERHFLLRWHGDAVGARVHERMLEVYEARAAELHGALYDGIDRVVAAVRGAGLETGIVTGKSRRAFEVSRRHVDLTGYRVVVVEDDVPAPKPDPAGIARALAALGADPAQAVYVGDTAADVEAARQAGVRPAAATWARGGDVTDEGVWSLARPDALLARLGLG